MRFPVVLFDLDGTVIDSGAIILASMRHAARTVLRREIADEELLAAVGGPGLVEQMRLIDEDRLDDLIHAYRRHNEPLHAELVVCDGMAELLDQLRAEGRRLGVVTAKRRVTVALAFHHVPIGHLFDTVVGADDTDRHKPHPDPLVRALTDLGARPEDAAYVGDSPFDVRAAKAAGVYSIAETWGGIHPEERLAAAEPDALVHTAQELRGVLA
jgi:pyrophosphatase PpaX